MDPRNGEILALVSKPSYDPNLFANPQLHTHLASLQKKANMPYSIVRFKANILKDLSSNHL